MKNKTEQRGFIWLSVLLVAVLVALLLIPHKSKSVPFDEETAETANLVEQKSQNHRQPAGKYSTHHSTAHKNKSATQNPEHLYTRQSSAHNSSFNSQMAKPDFSVPQQQRHEVVVDINTADTLDFQDLRGIGTYFARAIVKYRDLLGGYIRKEQLLEVYGMTADRYNAIAPHIVLGDASVRKIKINTASYAELRRHPYIDNYQAKAIVRLRSAGTLFHNADDLLKISIIDRETINKITPYLDFGISETPQKTITHNDTIHSGSDGPNA